MKNLHKEERVRRKNAHERASVFCKREANGADRQSCRFSRIDAGWLETSGFWSDKNVGLSLVHDIDVARGGMRVERDGSFLRGQTVTRR